MNGSSTILVVDDDSHSLRLVTDILTAEGYAVRPADSGELALTSAGAIVPDVILLDIRMPGMDGFEVCRQLKADSRTRAIPIIFLSATGQLEDRVEGLSLGAADFITKPFHAPELLARVRVHTELGRLRSSLERQVAERTAELSAANQKLRLELEERRRTEMELRESEERFRSLADRAPVGIWVTSPSRQLTFCNRRALFFLGRTGEEVIGSDWTDYIYADDIEAARSRYHLASIGRRGFRIECRMRRGAGKFRWTLHSGIPRFVAGVFAGYIGTSIDITDLKRKQEDAIAHHKLESLGVLTAGIAHDFNNLLATILAEADVALSDVDEDSPARGNITRITGIANRASEIVNLLMTYAGDRDTSAEKLDLSKIAAEVLFLMRPPMSQTAELDLQLAKDLPAVQANGVQIRQVLMNLVANASEALKGEPGRITVRTGYRHIGSVAAAQLHLAAPGDYCQLDVTDTGCGMPAEVQALVFDPFYTTKFVGRGLGLAVVQGILRAQGGAINVVSSPGKGSTFEVLLPCFAASAAGQELRNLEWPDLSDAGALSSRVTSSRG